MANCARFVWQYSMIVVAMSDGLQTIILRSYSLVCYKSHNIITKDVLYSKYMYLIIN